MTVNNELLEELYTARDKLKDDIVVTVVDRLIDRSSAGMNTYGVPMTREDTTMVEWIDHTVEELLDAACYLERLKQDVQQVSTMLEGAKNGGEVSLERDAGRERLRQGGDSVVLTGYGEGKAWPDNS